MDGTGLSITNIGVGSYRYRVTFKGPGGHSFGAFGMANPIQAMGRAIAKIDAFEVPTTPKTTFNVGRVGGGTSVNAIPFEAWMEVDMRSSDKASLEAVNAKFKNAVRGSGRGREQALERTRSRFGDVRTGGLSPGRQHVGRFGDCDHGARGIEMFGHSAGGWAKARPIRMCR